LRGITTALGLVFRGDGEARPPRSAGGRAGRPPPASIPRCPGGCPAWRPAGSRSAAPRGPRLSPPSPPARSHPRRRRGETGVAVPGK